MFLAKALIPAASVLMLSGVSYATWTAYQAGGGFNPQLSSSRAMQDNQVIFPGQEKVGSNDDTGADSGDSSMWEKNQDAQESIKPDVTPDAPQLFQDSIAVENPQDAGQLVSEVTDPQMLAQLEEQMKNPQNDAAQNSAGAAGNVILTPGNSGDKNVVVPGGTGGTGSNHGGSGGGSGSGSSGNGSGGSSDDGGSAGGGSGAGGGTGTGGGTDSGEPSGPEHPDDPENPDVPVNPENPTEPDKPVTDPDPEPTLPDDSYPGDGGDVTTRPFPEGGITSNPGDQIQTVKFFVTNEDISSRLVRFYHGEPLNDWKMLCSVYAYVIIEEGENKETYRLTAYSDCFKVGEFPKTAEEDFSVPFYFRMNPDSEEWLQAEVTQTVYDNKTLIVAGDGSTIETEMLSVGDVIDLSAFDYAMLPVGSIYEDEPLDEIFPGWAIEGTTDPLPREYEVTGEGRIVIYPLPKVPVPSGMEVVLHFDWDTVKYYQTLISYSKLTRSTEKDVLQVPEGIGCVIADFWEGGITADVLAVPKNVSYIEANAGLQIKEQFDIADDNIDYCSKDGVLYDKDQTVLYRLPSAVKTLTVPDTVMKVDFEAVPWNAAVEKIYFTSSYPPEFYGNCGNAVVYAPSDCYSIYQAEWGKTEFTYLPDDGSAPNTEIADGAVYSLDRTMLYNFLVTTNGSFILPVSVVEIKDRAADQCGQLDMVLLPENFKKLGSRALTGANVSRIVCLNNIPFEIQPDSFGNDGSYPEILVPEESYDAYLSAWSPVLTREIALKILVKSNLYKETYEGYEYLVDKNQNLHGTHDATLLKAPLAVKLFDKTVLPEDICLTRIEGQTFANHNALVYVELPETVKEIGASAFKGCTKLQGLMCYSSDTIFIGDGSLDDCSSLRFAAFYAEDAEFEDYYSPEFSGYGSVGFALGDGAEYPDNSFTTGYDAFELIQLNGNSDITEMILYGSSKEIDPLTDKETEKTDWTLLAALSGVKGEIPLRDGTNIISAGAFADCTNPFWIQLDYFKEMKEIQDYAFYNSGFLGNADGAVYLADTLTYIGQCAFQKSKIQSADIAIVKCYMLDYENQIYEAAGFLSGNAFADCKNLTTVTFEQQSNVGYIGSSAFDSCGLQQIVIPNTVTNLYNGAFQNCSGLEQVTFADKTVLTEIPYHAFSKTALTSITIPKSVMTIGSEAFSECKSLSNIAFETDSDLWTIDPYAFYNTAIETIRIPASVQIMFYNIFEKCLNLQSLIMEGDNPPALVSWGIGAGYQWMSGALSDKFGIQIDCGDEVHAEDICTAYVDDWKFSFAGYSNWEETMDAQYEYFGKHTTEEQIQAVMDANKLVLPCELQLRKWMGMSTDGITMIHEAQEELDRIEGKTVPEIASVSNWNLSSSLMVASDSNWHTASDSNWSTASGSNWTTASGSDWGSGKSSGGWNLSSFLAWLTEPSSEWIYDESGYLGNKDIYGADSDGDPVDIPEQPIAVQPAESVTPVYTAEKSTDTGEQEEE